MKGSSLSSKVITVMHSGSLEVLCKSVNREFESRHASAKVVDVSGGGVKLVRDLAKGNACDVYASVDYADVPKLMIPELAEWYVVFASTGFALRYTDQSAFSKEIDEKNWIDVIQRDGARFWRSDPEGDPAGYRSLMVFQLAEKYYGIPGLQKRLAEKSGRQFLSASLLAERDEGYSFSYTSHMMGGMSLPLPDEINLSNLALADYYRQAAVTIAGIRPSTSVTMLGEPIRAGITIPKTCTNQELANAWVSLLLSSKGKTLIEQSGMRPLEPTFGGDLSKVPKKVLEHSE